MAEDGTEPMCQQRYVGMNSRLVLMRSIFDRSRTSSAADAGGADRTIIGDSSHDL